jgi:hypothetical protein
MFKRNFCKYGACHQKKSPKKERPSMGGIFFKKCHPERSEGSHLRMGFFTAFRILTCYPHHDKRILIAIS